MTLLPQQAINEIRPWKAKGGKVHLLLPEVGQAAVGCTNCLGTGKLSIEFIVGGPYEIPHSAVVKNHDGSVKEVHSAVSFKDSDNRTKWYKRRIKSYDCPKCTGQGGR